jgi:DNA-binding LacI/PurR family transcriptional regulator
LRNVLAELRLDSSSDLTIVGQIRAQLTLLIADGQLEPGTRLPAVRTLANALDVNVNTVRAAYARLEDDGLVATRHGVGTIVQPSAAGTLRGGGSRSLSNSVGVLIAGLDPFYLELLRGIEARAERQGTLVLIVAVHDSSERATAAIRQLAARGAEGIIAASIGGPEKGTPAGSLPPIVYVDQPDRKGEVLVFDAERAGYETTRHLLDHGHSRIGYVTAPLEYPNQRELFDGYRRALTEAGLEADPAARAVVDDFDVAAGRRGLGQLLERGDWPPALMVSSGMLAIGVLEEARLQGLDVPDDLAIAGYADVDVTRSTHPPLTMVSLPTYDVGVAAMTALQRMIASPARKPERVVFPGTLEIRGSCGPHPANAADREIARTATTL